MYLKIKLITVFSVLAWFATFGQNLSDDLQKISEKMSSATSVSIEVNVKAYSKKGGKKLYESKAALFRSGVNSKAILGELEFITTKEYEVRIDHEEHAIMIQKQTQSKKSVVKLDKDFDVEALRKLLKPEDEKVTPVVKLTSNESGIKKYSITGLADLVELSIVLDINNLKILTIQYEYGTAKDRQQYITLDYTDFEYNKDLGDKFQLSSYFKVVNERYVISEKYKDYKLYTEE